MRQALAGLDSVGLEELTAEAGLQARFERKYIVTAQQAEQLLERLAPTHRALEIAGCREFAYRTLYYDTPDLLCLREHLQERRRRFKCRRRDYLDSGGACLELKLRGPRGETVKHAAPPRGGAALCAADRTFIEGTLAREHGRALDVEALRPTLAVEAIRVTLACLDAEERLTLDVAVSVGGWRLRPGLVIAEAKTRGGSGAADAALRALGLRQTRCSKYCVGMMLSRSPTRGGAFRPAARRFVPQPA